LLGRHVYRCAEDRLMEPCCSVRSVNAWCIALTKPKSMTLGTGLSS
jgi:hypothetical protein